MDFRHFEKACTVGSVWDIKHLLKEAEEAKTNETKNETKSEPSGAENLTQGTALLGQTELFTVIDAKVDDIEDKIKAVSFARSLD